MLVVVVVVRGLAHGATPSQPPLFRVPGLILASAVAFSAGGDGGRKPPESSFAKGPVPPGGAPSDSWATQSLGSGCTLKHSRASCLLITLSCLPRWLR
jgi:hypothetical protein